MGVPFTSTIFVVASSRSCSISHRPNDAWAMNCDGSLPAENASRRHFTVHLLVEIQLRHSDKTSSDNGWPKIEDVSEKCLQQRPSAEMYLPQILSVLLG